MGFDARTPLLVECLGGHRWRLVEHFHYTDPMPGWAVCPIRVDVPSGFVTDFASTRVIWPIMPPTGPYGKVAALHDWLYKIGTLDMTPACEWDGSWALVTRAYADALLRRGLRDLGCGWGMRRALWLGVRVGGGSTWARYRAAKLARHETLPVLP